MDRNAVRPIVERARGESRTDLTAAEAAIVCRAYDLPVVEDRSASNAEAAVAAANSIGYPVALKILSADISHKSDAGGIKLGLANDADVRRAFDEVQSNARAHDAKAHLDGVLVQAMAKGGREVIVGAITDPTFGKVVMFGLGGIFTEVLSDVTFAMAPVSPERARTMVSEIRGYQILAGARGEAPIDFDALARVVSGVSQLVTDVPEIAELDLNPVFVNSSGATAVDARIVIGEPAPAPVRPERAAIVKSMQRTMHPRSIAVIGASAEEGKIGYSVVRNLIDGGFAGPIYPVNPRLAEIQGLKAYPSIKDIPDEVEVAVFALPAALVAGALDQAGE